MYESVLKYVQTKERIDWSDRGKNAPEDVPIETCIDALRLLYVLRTDSFEFRIVPEWVQYFSTVVSKHNAD